MDLSTESQKMHTLEKMEKLVRESNPDCMFCAILVSPDAQLSSCGNMDFEDLQVVFKSMLQHRNLRGNN